jgi:UDP-2,3-diacylglucosamine hydrolase
MSEVAGAVTDRPLGIICGGGSIPIAVADAVSRRGRKVVLFPLVGWADAAAVAAYPHHWIHVGQFGRFCRLATAAGTREIVFIGSLLRPAISQVRLDWKTVRVFPRIVRAFRGGDDHLLSGIGGIFEDNGFRLVGAHEVAPEILMAEGALGTHLPRDRDRNDIACGLDVLAALGSFDVGQAVVVADGHVLAVEAAEGTDRMLARIADLRRAGRIRLPGHVGVMVKAPKASQDQRFDLPTVGPETIEAAARAELAGVAIVAGSTIAVDPQRMATVADAAKLFVVGVLPGRSP